MRVTATVRKLMELRLTTKRSRCPHPPSSTEAHGNLWITRGRTVVAPASVIRDAATVAVQPVR
jgi:hypothetical protein